jgi:hypothetical protein
MCCLGLRVRQELLLGGVPLFTGLVPGLAEVAQNVDNPTLRTGDPMTPTEEV